MPLPPTPTMIMIMGPDMTILTGMTTIMMMDMDTPLMMVRWLRLQTLWNKSDFWS